MCFCVIFTFTACPYRHFVKHYHRLCPSRLADLSSPSAVSPSPRPFLPSRASYVSLTTLLDPAGTASVASGGGVVNYKRMHETTIPFPSPPQEVVLARAGGVLSGCKEEDTVVSKETWDAGGGGFGCPVCKAREVRVNGEFWREFAARVKLPDSRGGGGGDGDDGEVFWADGKGGGVVEESGWLQAGGGLYGCGVVEA